MRGDFAQSSLPVNLISAVEDFNFVIELGDLALPRKTATSIATVFITAKTPVRRRGPTPRPSAWLLSPQAFAAEAELNFERPLLDRYQPVDFGRQHVEH